MISLLKYTKNYRKELILGPTFKFLEAVFELLLPLYMARLIDQGIAKNDNPYIIKTAITMIVMSLIGLICVLICQYYAAIASQGFGTELRNQLFKKINTLSYQDINRFGTVTLITRMTSDINQLQLALAMLIRLVIRAPFLSVGSIVMASYLNSQMALIFILTLPLFCLILYWMMKKTIPLYKKVQLKLDQLNLVVQENLSGVRVIRAFGQKKRDINKLAHTADALAEASKRVTNISAVLNPATILIMNTAIVILLYVGGVNVNSGSMTQGQVLALINYLMQMLLALIVVANLVVIFTRASASASRVNEVLNVVPSINDTAVKLVASSQETLCLEFKDVSFRYEAKSGLALDHISFKVKGGETLGIIGPTGSGKTTLSQLIPRFYDVTTGEVSINHVDVGQQSLSSLRSLIAIVPQTSILFTGTIKDNLCWGKQDATDEECWQALKTAQCLDFVTTLPLKLETVVREGGKNFSGGQRQRLAIARALIKQPALLILDDSLSALDYQTDQELRRALKRDMSTTLIIIISQRLSSIKHAQQILVLDNGQQVGLGTHQELLASTTTYQEIVLSQQEQEEE